MMLLCSYIPLKSYGDCLGDGDVFYYAQHPLCGSECWMGLHTSIQEPVGQFNYF